MRAKIFLFLVYGYIYIPKKTSLKSKILKYTPTKGIINCISMIKTCMIQLICNYYPLIVLKSLAKIQFKSFQLTAMWLGCAWLKSSAVTPTSNLNTRSGY